MSEEINAGATQEEIDAAVKQIRDAVKAFNGDPRHETYKHTEKNRDVVDDYMKAHDLEWSPESLHLAFVELKKDGKLDLYADSKITTPEPAKETEAALPAVGKATADDLGVGFTARQKAHQNVEGVRPMSNREAFIRAAEKAASQKQPGGRRHL